MRILLICSLLIAASENVSAQVVTRVIYVNAAQTNPNLNGLSWATAKKYLQDAIAITDNDLGTVEQIWVRKGTYKPVKCVSNNCVCIPPGGTYGTCSTSSSLRASSFNLKNTVHIYGGFFGFETCPSDRLGDPDPFTADGAWDSILSGDINGNDGNLNAPLPTCDEVENTEHIVRANGTNTSAILDGFTLTRGCDNASSDDSGGAGIRFYNGGTATIRNCSILRNRVTGGGGGVYLFGGGTTGAWLINCVIAYNQAGHGGGIGSKASSTQRIINTQIVENTANFQGGGIYLGEAGNSDIRFANSLIVRNTVGVGFGEGAGMYLNGGVYILDNTTIAYNAATTSGGGITVVGSSTSADIDNSIIWGNTAPLGPQIRLLDGSATVNYSDVEGGYAGDHNINSDPLFVDRFGPAYNYALGVGSPCRDAAKNLDAASDEADLDNDGITLEAIPFDVRRGRRFVNDSSRTDDPGVPGFGYAQIIDMGAYERCASDADCEDGDPCTGGSESCLGERGCRSSFGSGSFDDCNGNFVVDACDILEGDSVDCNGNGIPDECCEGNQLAILVGTSPGYDCDSSLPKVKHNVIRLKFSCPVALPTAGQVEIRYIGPTGVLGVDNSNLFEFTVLEDSGRTLRIKENPPSGNAFIAQSWYAIMNTGVWPGVAPFEMDYVAVDGDADNTLTTDFADISFIFANLTGTAADDNRSDINDDTFVDFADISAANGFYGSTAPPKPPGRICTLP